MRKRTTSPSSAERDRHRAEPVRQLAREASVRLAVAVEDRVHDADPAVGVANLRRLEPRDELRDRALDRQLVVALHVRDRARLAGVPVLEPLLERVQRRRHELRLLLEAEARPHDAGRLVRRQHVEADEPRALLACVPRAFAQERLRDALPAGARTDVDELDVRASALRRLDARDAERALAVLGEEDAAGADVVERVRPLLRPRLRFLERPRAPPARTPPRARGGPPRRPRSQDGSSRPGQPTREEVVRRQVLERMEARAELGHSDTVETLGRLAEREVAGRPGVRAGEVAGEEPLGRPRAETRGAP